MSEPTSQASYVKNEHCPVCDSEMVSGGPVDISNGQAFQNIDCDGCGAYWTDVYKLIQYDNLHDSKGDILAVPEVSDEQKGK